LAACSLKPTYTEVESNENEKIQDNRIVTIIESKTDSTELDPDFVGLHPNEGISLLEPSKFNGYARRFIIRIYSYVVGKTPIEIGNYDISKMQFSLFKFDPYYLQYICTGQLLLCIDLDNSDSKDVYGSVTFPETVISIRDSLTPYVRKDSNRSADDNKYSKYRNALYVYLPSFILYPGRNRCFFIDDDGSTLDAIEICVIRTRQVKLVPARLARASCGQIYPPCHLTFSNRYTVNFSELNRHQGIIPADISKFKEGYCIEAIAINKEKNTAWKIGHLDIESDYSINPYKVKAKYINGKEVWLKWNLKQLNFCWDDIPSSHEQTKRLLDCIEKYTKLPIKENSFSVEKIKKEVWLKWNLKQLNFCWDDIPSSHEQTKRLLDCIEKYYLKLLLDKDSQTEYQYKENFYSAYEDDNDNDNDSYVSSVLEYMDIIRIYNEQRKSFFIILNKRKKRAILYFGNNRIFEFDVQIEDDKTNIYSRISFIKPSHFKSVRLLPNNFELKDDLMLTTTNTTTTTTNTKTTTTTTSSTYGGSSSSFNTSNIKKDQEDAIRKIVEDVLNGYLPQKKCNIRIRKMEGEPFFGKNNTFEFEVDILLDSKTIDKNTLIQNVQEIKKIIEDYYLFANDGDLVLCIYRTSFDIVNFPLCEIILTNSSGKSIIVYLPQIILSRTQPRFYIYVASDGSTSFDSALSTCCRFSAGQVMPMGNKYPLQYRVPAFLNLSDWNSANKIPLGQIAIDPEHGRFAFSSFDCIDTLKENVTADYNYAFSADIGSGTFERRSTLMSPNIWISKKGHVPYDIALPSKTFKNFDKVFSFLNSKFNYDPYDEIVIQIDDSSIYKEQLSLKVPSNINNFTLQAANHCVPTLEITEEQKSPCFIVSFDCFADNVLFNGLTITGGPLSIYGEFNNFKMIFCTLDSGFKEKRFVCLETYCSEPKLKKETKTKNISFSKTISGSIVFDHNVSSFKAKDSIIENMAGLAINLKLNCQSIYNNCQKNTFKLESIRSDILSKYGHPFVLDCKDIFVTDSILSSKIKVLDGDANSCIRYSRYEEGSIFKKRLSKKQ